jgi:acyl transferase domain-containing protein
MTRGLQPGVAIVGIGCRFPGGVIDVETYWRLLVEGREAVTEIPPDRLDVVRYFNPEPATPGRMMTRRGGFLDRLDEFDASFFGISPREAERVDPQQRLLLETAWEAIEDAGVDASTLQGSRTGVFIGQWTGDFESRLFADPEAVDFYMTTGSGRYAASGRISYALGLRGPSLTLDTACSSSLAAIHLAVRSIRSGESGLALVGGSNLILQPHITIAYSQSRMIAPDGRCKFGDASGDGYVRSEGVAVVVLKPLNRALADGDRIYAVLAGSALNNDGSSSGSMGTPSRTGQQELLLAAYQDAGISPTSVGYFEAHGTGTRVGDPVEIGAIADVVGNRRGPANRTYIGSVKTNIGHTEAVAGLAGLIKGALSLERETIPRSLHCKDLNPSINWSDVPLEIARRSVSWPRTCERRVAGVSAFGIAGTNAHVVLQEVPTAAALPEGKPAPVLPISARSDKALRNLADRVADLLASDDALSLAEVCAHAQLRRAALSHRAAFVVLERTSLIESMRAFAHGAEALAQGTADEKRPAKLAFVCPGQGGQWGGMALALAVAEPAFSAALERLDRALRVSVEWSLVEQLETAARHEALMLDSIDLVQPTLAALSLAYAELFRAYGVQADAVVGHSMGEAPAAALAGALSAEDALRIVALRSRLMRKERGKGAMALVDAPAAEVEARLSIATVSIAAVNSPRACIISGGVADVTRLVEDFEREGVFARLVKVDVASHSAQMTAAAGALQRALAGLEPRKETCNFASALLGGSAVGEELGASYWARNLREPVRFADATQHLIEDGVSAFVELGPHPVLGPSIEQTARALGRNVTVSGCGRRDVGEREAFFTALAQMWCAGVTVDWRRAAPRARHVGKFPLYPWQRRRHWPKEAELRDETQFGAIRSRGPDERERQWLHELAWRPFSPSAPRPGGRWVVVGDAEDVAAALRESGVTVDLAPLDGLEQVLSNADSGNVLVSAVNAGTEASYLPVRVAHAAGAGNPKIWFLTRAAHAPRELERVDVDQAALWGAARVFSEEHPDLWGGILDLRREPTQDDAQAAAGALLGPKDEDQLAITDGAVFALRIVAAPASDGAILRWRPDASYLLTGGLGGVGLAVARAMAEQGARRLILASRRGLPPRAEWRHLDPSSLVGRRAAAVREIEAAGVSVLTPAFDVADAQAVENFLDTYAAEGWPPIKGVVHLAATMDSALMSDMTRDRFFGPVAAKLRGAQILDERLPELDAFVLFSSIGVHLVQAGGANYAAANAGLEGLTRDRLSRGQHAASIAWGIWNDTGLSEGEAAAANTRYLVGHGITGFDAGSAANVMRWAAGRKAPNSVVAAVDWAQYGRARANKLEPFVREMVGEGNAVRATEIFSLPRDESREALARIVRDALASTLKLEPGEIAIDREFGTMGLTSLLSLELRGRLERALGRALPAALAWNYPTVSKLVAHIGGEAKIAPSTTQTPEMVALGARLSAVAALPDADALSALRKQRAAI